MTISSHDIPLLDDEARLQEIEARQSQVARLLEASKLEAILLEDPVNIAWFTGGAVRSVGECQSAVLFITPDARVVLTDNVSGPELFESQLAGMGFQLKERPWHHPLQNLIHDICHGRRVGSAGRSGMPDISSELAQLRLPLTDRERNRLRSLGRDVAHAVEATGRRLQRNSTESDVAGELVHRLYRRGVHPVSIQVCADGRRGRIRPRQPGEVPIRQSAVLHVIGQRDGLHAAAGRTIAFDQASRELTEAHQAAIMIQATGLRFSQPGWSIAETWQRVARLYEKTGHANEWQLSPQGCVSGYRLCEAAIQPDSEFQLQAGMPICWQTSIGPALAADTMICSEQHFEPVTPMEKWPKLQVKVKDLALSRPGILVLTEDRSREIDEPDTSADALSWLAEDSHFSKSAFE